jgi:hypothetical protein
MKDELRDHEGDETGGYVVEHDSGAFGEPFEAADWPGLEDVEETEEDEAKDGECGCGGESNEGEELAGYLVDDDVTWVFASGLAGDDGCGGDTDEGDDYGGYQGADREDKWIGMKQMCGGVPEKHGGYAAIGSGPGFEVA